METKPKIRKNKQGQLVFQDNEGKEWLPDKLQESVKLWKREHRPETWSKMTTWDKIEAMIILTFIPVALFTIVYGIIKLIGLL